MQIELKNYKSKALSISDLSMPMKSLNAVIGGNGAGKSALLSKAIHSHLSSFFSPQTALQRSALSMFSIDPMIFSISSSESHLTSSLAQFTGLHTSIINLFLQHLDTEHKFTTKDDIIAKVIETSSNTSKIFAKIQIRRSSDITNITDRIYNVKKATEQDWGDIVLLTDIDYSTGETILIKLPSETTSSKIGIKKDIQVLLNHSNPTEIIVCNGHRKTSIEISASTHKVISDDFLPSCTACSGVGFLMLPPMEKDKIIHHSIGDIQKMLESLENSEKDRLDAPPHDIVFLGLCIRLGISNKAVLGTLNLDIFDKIINGSKDDNWTGLSIIFKKTGSLGGRPRARQTKFDIQKTCPSCSGSGVCANNMLPTICNMSIQDVFSMDSEALIKFVASYSLQGFSSVYMAQIELIATMFKELGISYLPINRMAASISYGEKKRIHIVRMISYNLSGCIFTCDDILVGLDISSQAKTLRLLKQISKQNNCVLFSCTDHSDILNDYIDSALDLDKAPSLSFLTIKDCELPGGSFALTEDINKAHVETVEIGKPGFQKFDIASMIEKHRLIEVYGESGRGKTTFLKSRVIPEIMKITKSTSRMSILSQEDLSSSSDKVSVLQYCGLYALLDKQLPDHIKKYERFSFAHPAKSKLACSLCLSLGIIKRKILNESIETPCPSCRRDGFASNRDGMFIHGVSVSKILSMNVGDLCKFSLENNMPYTASSLKTIVNLGGAEIPLSSKMSKISKGEQKILSLANIVSKASSSSANSRHYIILDEPTNYLSIKNSVNLFNILDFLKNQKNVRIIISQSLSNVTLDVDLRITVV